MRKVEKKTKPDTGQAKMPEPIPKTVVPRRVYNAKMEYRIANLQSVGKREAQEDSFAFGNALDEKAIAEKGLLIIVADGMGGMKNGKLASETAITTIMDAFHSFDPAENIAEQLREALFSAGDSVWNELDGSGGSTVVAGVIYKEKLYMASIGDSYVFLLRNRQLVRLNRSQNVLNREYLEVILDDGFDGEAARRHPERDAITQFLGMTGLDEVDYFRRPLKLLPGDVLLFCSDGVGGVLNEQQLTDCLSFGQPENMCTSLNKEITAINSKYQDNYTALVVQCRK